jgi:hypothetical protein
VVLHRFDLATGKLVDTRKFKDTPRVDRRENNALGQRTAVRTP